MGAITVEWIQDTGPWTIAGTTLLTIVETIAGTTLLTIVETTLATIVETIAGITPDIMVETIVETTVGTILEITVETTVGTLGITTAAMGQTTTIVALDLIMIIADMGQATTCKICINHSKKQMGNTQYT